MFGCCSRAAASASRRKRATKASSSARCSASSLTATGRSSTVSLRQEDGGHAAGAEPALDPVAAGDLGGRAHSPPPLRPPPVPPRARAAAVARARRRRRAAVLGSAGVVRRSSGGGRRGVGLRSVSVWRRSRSRSCGLGRLVSAAARARCWPLLGLLLVALARCDELLRGGRSPRRARRARRRRRRRASSVDQLVDRRHVRLPARRDVLAGPALPCVEPALDVLELAVQRLVAVAAGIGSPSSSPPQPAATRPSGQQRGDEDAAVRAASLSGVEPLGEHARAAPRPRSPARPRRSGTRRGASVAIHVSVSSRSHAARGSPSRGWPTPPGLSSQLAVGEVELVRRRPRSLPRLAVARRAGSRAPRASGRRADPRAPSRRCTPPPARWRARTPRPGRAGWRGRAPSSRPASAGSRPLRKASVSSPTFSWVHCAAVAALEEKSAMSMSPGHDQVVVARQAEVAALARRARRTRRAGRRSRRGRRGTRSPRRRSSVDGVQHRLEGGQVAVDVRDQGDAPRGGLLQCPR